MFAKTLTFVTMVAAALGAAVQTKDNLYKSFEGVDPNSLHCDPLGHIFLLLPHFTDCSKFYMCAHGAEVEVSCPRGTIFDFVLQTCNWEWATECILRDLNEEDLEGSGDGYGEDEIAASWGNILNDKQEVYPLSSISGVRPIGVERSQSSSIINCLRADSAAKRVGYAGDCQRYWRCIDGVPQAVFCSDGLFFNAATQQCDHEGNSKCVVQADNELDGEFLLMK